MSTIANTRLRQRRESTPSPSGSGRPMSRSELAEAVNAHVLAATGRHAVLDASTIARYERGLIHWPRAHHRAGLRAALNAATDHDLGFYPTPRGPGRPAGG
ncbi:helix-turn-helix domain-containing protein [Myceligenerans indicum]|uniref:Helix-turn-helix transcriptional regulator n=1 Tax=Myceligenerans indicum TaxID=2593663 RepID=A0ABS1LQQ5_9MICO|nr:helix-turn-helix domain-containing protein [Myceligenerans indicum]MBL0888539.1 helix-turn-helix transcriptional regulator [Myceligenerans indicum]